MSFTSISGAASLSSVALQNSFISTEIPAVTLMGDLQPWDVIKYIPNVIEKLEF